MYFSEDLANVLIRLVAAVVAGSAIGLDREVRHKPAGMRTHALVCLGAALLVVVVVRVGPGGMNRLDSVSRVIQGIIAGVGFLGGGAILKTTTGPEMVRGLTTAATIWLAASLGVACGAGQWGPVVIGTLLSVLIVIVGRPIEGFVHRHFRNPETPPPKSEG